jgi:hypothetical protein
LNSVAIKKEKKIDRFTETSSAQAAEIIKPACRQAGKPNYS